MSEDDVVDRAISILESRAQYGDCYTSPEDVMRYLQCKLARYEREVFAVMFLNTRHHLIEYKELFYGTVDSATVHPREVAKHALIINASAVILAHNHPSGISTPSSVDITLTERLKKALDLFDIRTLDHIVVGFASSVSMANEGLI